MIRKHRLFVFKKFKLRYEKCANKFLFSCKYYSAKLNLYWTLHHCNC